MTNLKERMMPDTNGDGGSILKNIVVANLAIIGVLFFVGLIVGISVAHFNDGGGPMSLKAMGIITGAVVILISILVFAFRPLKALVTTSPDQTPRERLNHYIMWGCGILGGVVAVCLILFSPDKELFGAFSNSSIPAAAAILLAAIWAGAMPIVAYFWHKRAIDEQEAAAYRDGAYYAAYAYIIGAPTWWILARGGLVPQINGVAIFLIFNFIWLGVWFYKKYR